MTLNSGSNLNINITGVGAAGSAYDQVSVTGTVTLGTAVSNLIVSASNLTAANIGQTYFIALNDGTDLVSGTFAQGATVTSGSDTFLINYLANGDGGLTGNDISLTLASVPEPSAWFAAALALGAILCSRWKRIAVMLAARMEVRR